MTRDRAFAIFALVVYVVVIFGVSTWLHYHPHQ